MILSNKYEEVTFVRDYMKMMNLPYKKNECIEYLRECISVEIKKIK